MAEFSLEGFVEDGWQQRVEFGGGLGLELQGGFHLPLEVVKPELPFVGWHGDLDFLECIEAQGTIAACPTGRSLTKSLEALISQKVKAEKSRCDNFTFLCGAVRRVPGDFAAGR